MQGAAGARDRLSPMPLPPSPFPARPPASRARWVAEAVEAEGGAAGAADREARARRLYERAYRSLRESQPDAKEEAVMLLEAWRDFEAAGSPGSARGAEEAGRAVEAVSRKMPRRVKRKRAVLLEDGTAAGGMEEYYDYIFPVQREGEKEGGGGRGWRRGWGARRRRRRRRRGSRAGQQPGLLCAAARACRGGNAYCASLISCC